MFFTADSPDVAADVLNADLETLKLGAERWLINFNDTKTESMIISMRMIAIPLLTFNDTVKQEAKCHKHLGLTISNGLTWYAHISSKMLDVLQKLKWRLDRKFLECIYFSFIHPKLEYAGLISDKCTVLYKEL